MAVKGAAYAGANIANSVKGGIPIPAGGTGTSGGSAAPDVPVNQPAIGGYVQETVYPRGQTNYMGVDTKIAYDTNVLGEGNTDPFISSAPQPDWTCPMDDNAVTGGIGQWVKSASALIPTDKVTIALGVATKDNAAGTHNVFATVKIGQFFWAPTVA
jgi:hypothetical protein